ncbi:MAG: T9SS type A sorting domain-containing protein [Bacteroidota bacterium]
MKRATLYLLLPMLFTLTYGTESTAQCESTNIEIADGTTTAYTCPGDNNDDLIDLTNDGNGTTEYAYVATDMNNNILGINPTSTFNFEGAGTGTCFVWGFSYTGDITAQQGDFLFGTPFSNGCFQISNNRLTIVRDTPDGGTINNTGGSNSVTFCTADDFPDQVLFTNTTNSSSAYTYVITDDNNTILGNTNDQSFDFSGVPPGVCRIWGLSYAGNLTLTNGANAAATDLSDDCFDLSDNFIEVIRTDVDGGTVADANGATSLTTCAGDDIADVVTFTHVTNSGATYGYIITDENDIVLGVPPGNSQDFNGAGDGTCRVWGISYTGNLTIFGGDNILNKSLSDDCYDLSENFIEVVRTGVDGGEVFTTDGESTVYTCPGDGISDEISFVQTNDANDANFTYVVTDADGIILGLPPGDTQNFEGAGTGTCLVWGLSYTGNLTAMMGDNALTTALSDGCFALSDNFVSVIRDVPNGGEVTTVDGATVAYTCPGNGVNDIIEFTSTGASNSNFTYVVTDDQNNILGIPPGNVQNFEGAGTGICRVWGLSYTGNITAQVGDNAATTALTDGCFSLSSNFVDVVREQPEAGTLDAAGMTTVYTCPGDSNADVIDFTAEGFNQNYQLVITDDNFNILGLPPTNSQDFEGAGVGVCLAWGVAYTGSIVATAGDNIFSSPFSSDCWDFSDPVRVVRDTPDGGMVQNNSGNNVVEVCTTDGNPDVISYTNTSTSTSAYTYLITDDNNTILGIHPFPDFDFEGVPPGICRIWGLSYSGNLTATLGENAATATLSEGCFELSSNFVEVTRTDVDGGTVAMPSGATVRYTCTQDGNEDIVTFTHVSNSPANYIYVITDDNDNVLGLPPGNSQNFDIAPPGTCRVWGLSYTGDLTLFAGDNIMNKSLSTDCYDLSENFIAVIRDTPEGGTVSMPSGATERFTCAQDGNPDVVSFTNQGASNSNYAYVITTPALEILGVTMDDSFDFDPAPPGTCWVWGLAFTGNITAQVGDQADQVALTDDCFDLSDNFISVIRDVPDGGTVSMPSGATERFTCAQDGNPDVVSFTNQGASNSNYAYVITTPSLEILGVTMDDSFDFDPAPPGTCWVWGLAFTGNITAQVGDQADQVALTDDCFDLSDNFIAVIRDIPNGGTVQTTNGETEVTILAGDGISDVIEFESMGTSNSNFTYVITDDQNIILGIPPSNSQDFEGAGVGICRVWGLAYTGSITAQAGDDAAAVNLTDDCFSLSSNFIEVNRAQGLVNFNAGGFATNVTLEDITITPNPTSNFINVGFGKNFQEGTTAELRILNLQGQVVFSRVYDVEEIRNQRVELDVQAYNAGVYFLNLRTEDETLTERFVKQ